MPRWRPRVFHNAVAGTVYQPSADGLVNAPGQRATTLPPTLVDEFAGDSVNQPTKPDQRDRRIRDRNDRGGDTNLWYCRNVVVASKLHAVHVATADSQRWLRATHPARRSTSENFSAATRYPCDPLGPAPAKRSRSHTHPSHLPPRPAQPAVAARPKISGTLVAPGDAQSSIGCTGPSRRCKAPTGTMTVVQCRW